MYLEGQPWYEVQLTIPARNQAPFWQEWRAESKGRTPWEAAQVVAFEVHFLNNQLHPILDEEEEDPEMMVEDDGWEEDVDLKDEDNDISDLDSEHTED